MDTGTPWTYTYLLTLSPPVALPSPLHPRGPIRQGARGRRGGRDLGRAVRAVVVDHHHAQYARIILVEQRADRRPDNRRLVARRHDRHNLGRTAARHRVWDVDTPEAAAHAQQIEPHPDGETGDCQEHSTENRRVGKECV